MLGAQDEGAQGQRSHSLLVRTQPFSLRELQYRDALHCQYHFRVDKMLFFEIHCHLLCAEHFLAYVWGRHLDDLHP